MQKTPFSGLTVLEPGESIYADNSAFIDRDRYEIDRDLKIGAKTHRHDGGSGVPDPIVAPSGIVIGSGGNIPAGLNLSLGLTWEDAYGGETRLSQVNLVVTGSPLGSPSNAITAVADYTAGSLDTDTFTYAITYSDGEGGETPIGPSVIVTRDPGFANARIKLEGLNVGMSEAGAAAWRLYRARSGGEYVLLATGTTATFTDDGTVSAQCDVHPPNFNTNTTGGKNQIKVTLPSETAAGEEFINLYCSQSGSFDESCLVGQYPTGSAGSNVFITSLELLDHQPPDVNRSYGGASKIDPDTELIDWHWKRPVATEGDLPTEGEGTEEGDVRVSLADHSAFIFIEGAWIAWVGGEGEGGGGGGIGVDATEMTTIEDSFDSGGLDANWEALLHIGESFIEPSEFWEETGGHLLKLGEGGGGIAYRKDSHTFDGKVFTKFRGEESFACELFHILRSNGALHSTGRSNLLAGYSGGFGHGGTSNIKIEIIENGENFTLASQSFPEPAEGADYWLITTVTENIVTCLFYDEDPALEPAPVAEISADLEEEPGNPGGEASKEQREHYMATGYYGLLFEGAPLCFVYEWDFTGKLIAAVDGVEELSFVEGETLKVEPSEDGARVTIPGRHGSMGYVNCGEDLTKERPAYDGVTWLVTGGAGEPTNMKDGDILLEVEGVTAKQFIKVGGSLVEV